MEKQYIIGLVIGIILAVLLDVFLILKALSVIKRKQNENKRIKNNRRVERAI